MSVAGEGLFGQVVDRATADLDDLHAQLAGVGDRVTVAHMVLLHDCTLEDGSFVGMNACVMDGAVVEGGAMVAAGALVTQGKRAKAGELWAGRPAKPVRTLSEAELAEMERIVGVYTRLSGEYLSDGVGAPPQS